MLAGGSDGEQLAEVLLEREDELRSKEAHILELTQKLSIATTELGAFEEDRKEYEVCMTTKQL